MLSKIVITAALVASALAAPSATVVLESSGGGSGLTNTTVTIEINGLFDDSNKLAGVTALYLTGSDEVPLNSITCTPFSNPDGTDRVAPTFASGDPTHLSANDEIGSIVCITTNIPNAPLAPPGMGSSRTTTLATTAKATIDPTGAKASPTAADSQSTGNSASSLYLPVELFGGLALAGFGVAFAL